MAGFLDPKERVIDMVLTDVGKSLLLKGDLHFVYWIPFDDEVDYNPPAAVEAGDSRTLEEVKRDLVETPLVREATMGYRGLNYAEEDTTNVHRPMYSVPPGMGRRGQPYPLPQMTVSSGSLAVTLNQRMLRNVYVQLDSAGSQVVKQVGPVDVGYQRYGSTEAVLTADFPVAAFPPDYRSEGFLVTMYLSSALKTDELGQVTGGYEEILHNRDSLGELVYRNDLKINVYTP